MSEIYILGGGLSGIYSKLENNNSILIDKNDYITISTRLIYVINGENKSYAYKKRNVDIKDEVKDINFDEKKIITENKCYKYDKLIIALGHKQDINKIKGNEFLYKLETVEDALKIKDLSEKVKNINIIGGSYLGVELAGIFKDKNINLIESNNRLLPRSNEKASKYVYNLLKNNNVNIILNSKVSEVKENSIIINDKEIKSDLTIYSGGISGNNIINNLKIKSKNSRIIVDKYLKSIDYDDVYACGDSMIMNNNDIPMTAEIARESGKIAMKNALGNQIEFNYKLRSIINVNNNYILINNNSFIKGFTVKIIKNHVTKNLNNSLQMVNS